MSGRGVVLSLALLCAASTAVANDTEWQEPSPLLRHDPFETPALLDQPAPEPSSVQAVEEILEPWERELRATSVSSARSMINVDGVILVEGQELDGFRLVEVRERAAVFEKNGTKRTLTMDESELTYDALPTESGGRDR